MGSDYTIVLGGATERGSFERVIAPDPNFWNKTRVEYIPSAPIPAKETTVQITREQADMLHGILNRAIKERWKHYEVKAEIFRLMGVDVGVCTRFVVAPPGEREGMHLP